MAYAAVVGVPDNLRGGWHTSSPADLEARCRLVFASFKVPRCFLRVDGIPRTALGKIQKHLLPKLNPQFRET